MKEMQGASRKSVKSGQRSGLGDSVFQNPNKGRAAGLNWART